ncbi:ATP-binding cassette subfamily B protein [Actinokineospora baliensis]|uniref:ABC transporter ATP-binding protein n=1 Tax=Actinokineospora baliensis TaxID=547056 RepID=UPI00195AAB56|nr:ABC transporter ATP-binding protein [Actinokineospora baliensis]MBM7772263.1 ATP-binding cassette subfamily B protein [Actinokineospora baliensis]
MGGVREALGLTWRAGRATTLAFIVLTVITSGVPVAVAWLTKVLIDLLVAGGAAVDSVLVPGVLLAVSGLLAGLLPQAILYTHKELERRVGLVAQDRLFAATERFVGLARFEDPRFVDRLRLALQHGGATPGVVVSTVLSLGSTALRAVGFLASLVLLATWLPFAALASALPALAGEIWLAKRRAALHWELGPVERREMFYRALLTDVQAAKEIRLFGTGAHLRARMQRQRTHTNGEQRRMDRGELWVQLAAGAVTAGFAGGVLLWAVVAATGGRITVGDVSLVVAAIAGVQAAASMLVRDLGNSHKQLLLFNHYREVVGSDSDLPVAARPVAVQPLRRGIEFRDVWFRYSPNHAWVLRGVSFTVAHGASLGLVGRNGAGKSTLVKLLCRMYDPDRGAILWDGVDIREIDPAELRSRIGAVFQDYMNYDLTAAENIALGDLERGADRDAVRAAGGRAGADDFVSAMPKGYDTLLSRVFFQGDTHRGGSGMTLSGGQWQRLALARAYLRGERDLLILDEPSSGLDAEAEYRVHTDLREHRAGRTSVLISHRLGAVRDADLLVVLDEGQVVESGTHDELMARDGLYAGMFGSQAEGYQLGLPEAV